MTITQLTNLLEVIDANPNAYLIAEKGAPLTGQFKTCLLHESDSYEICYLGERGETYDFEHFDNEDSASVEFLKRTLSDRGTISRWIGATPYEEIKEKVEGILYSRCIPYILQKVNRGGSDKKWASFSVLCQDYKRARSLTEEFNLE